MTPDKRLYAASCVAGAYIAAVIVYFVPASYERIMLLIDEFSFIALLGLIGIAGDLLMAGLRAIPAALMGLMAGTPALLAGLYALRRYGQNRTMLLAAGAGLGLLNGGLVLLLQMNTNIVAVLCGFTLAGFCAAFYRLRAESERGHYN